jgi:hypothetical protein
VVVLAGLTVTLELFARVVLLTVVVVVVAGGEDAVSVVVTVLVRSGRVVLVVDPELVVAVVVVVSAQTGPPARAPVARPTISPAAAQSADLRTVARGAGQRTAERPITS